MQQTPEAIAERDAVTSRFGQKVIAGCQQRLAGIKFGRDFRELAPLEQDHISAHVYAMLGGAL